MKRTLALWLALCLLLIVPVRTGRQESVPELSRNGVSVFRSHQEENRSRQQLAVDYPTFECTDPALAQYLKEEITDPILTLFRQEQMADDSAYTGGALDTIRGGYTASMDFDGILSVEATVTLSAAGTAQEETLFFWRIIDLNGRRSLALEDLFTEDRAEVEQALKRVIFQNAASLVNVSEAASVPLGDSLSGDEGFPERDLRGGTAVRKVTVHSSALGAAGADLCPGDAADRAENRE